MWWRIILEFIAAALAVLGFYSLLRLLHEWLLAPGQLTAAIFIRSEADARNMDILLREADRSAYRRRGEPMVVLIDSALMEGYMGTGEELLSDYAELADRYGAVCFVVDRGQI